MARTDDLTVEKRVEFVRRALLSGNESNAAFVQDIAAQFGTQERQARNYIAKAKDQIREAAAVDKPYLLAEHLAHRRDLRRRAQRDGDFRSELAAAQDEAKLLGLYGPEQHEHNGTLTVKLTWGDSDDVAA